MEISSIKRQENINKFENVSLSFEHGLGFINYQIKTI